MLKNLDLENTLNKLIHDKKVSLACAIIFLVMLASTLVSFLSIFIKTNQKKTNDSTPAKIASSSIEQEHLFGKLSPPPAISQSTPSNLSLQAIFYAHDNSSKSSALISNNSEPGKLYYLNDLLPNGLKIQKILPDKVISGTLGNTQTLTLPIPKLEFSAPPQNILKTQ